MIKISVWWKKTLFNKERYYFTYGYCDNEDTDEILKAKIQFDSKRTLVKIEELTELDFIKETI